MTTEVTEADLPHLRRCVELATEAVEAGDFPFGSVLVAANGTVLAELGVPAAALQSYSAISRPPLPRSRSDAIAPQVTATPVSTRQPSRTLCASPANADRIERATQ